MFAEWTMVKVNHGSWETTSLLSLLTVVLQVINAAFERYRGLSFLRSEESRAPNALQAFDNLPLKLWNLQITSIITWNNHDGMWKSAKADLCTNQWRCGTNHLELGWHETKPSAGIRPYRIPACAWCQPHMCTSMILLESDRLHR